MPASALSSTCNECGNIAFHPGFTTESVKRARAEEESLKKRETREARATAVTSAPSVEAFLARERRERARAQAMPAPATTTDLTVDPNKIEEIQIRNQLEWQLWARVTEAFHDPNTHLAYMSFVARNLIFDKASERYKLHRQRFALLPGEDWQVTRADEMLDHIAALCAIQFERALRTPVEELDVLADRSRRLLAVFRAFLAFAGAISVAHLVVTIFSR